MEQWQQQLKQLKGKRVIVTGANSGIGYEAARMLAEQGARVTLACRNQSKGREALEKIALSAPDAELDLLPLDFSSLKSVHAFVERYTEAHGALDLLINNAGVMVPPFGKTEDGFELQFGSNYLGHFALTAGLMPLLDQAGEGRIVMLASTAAVFGCIRLDNLNAEKGYRPWLAYGQSKLACLMFGLELQKRLEEVGSDVSVNIAHPGWAASNLQNNTLIGKFNFLGQSSAKGALPTLRAACERTLPAGTYFGPNGFSQLRGQPVEIAPVKRALDREKAAALWQASEELTGIELNVAAVAG